MRTIGFVVNPIAGMGGRVGLKGTDGNVEEARKRGAEPRAPDRAIEALEALAEHNSSIEVLTWGGAMGADEAAAVGIDHEVLGNPAGEETTPEDTIAAVNAFLDREVDCVLFVGGDGTAVDVFETLDAAGSDTPMLGTPAGVKVYSSVFAVSPRAAGRIVTDFDRTERREVNDIDESAYREGEVRAELKGLANVPVAEDLQSSKQVLGGDVESLAVGITADTEPGITYVLGPGGTLHQIKAEMGIEGSPLGVDVVRDGKLLAKDASESEILGALGDKNRIVVSPIGGQGFIFGRGNDQISPAIIEACEIDIVASREKLDSTAVLRVDTGDEDLDESLRGWVRVRTGRYETRMMQIV